MAYEQLLADEGPIVEITDGPGNDVTIAWNLAAHVMLSFPARVNLYYDVQADRLGIREAVYSANTDSLFVTLGQWNSIEAAEHLENGGVEIEASETYVLNLGEIPGGPSPELAPICWIQL